MKVSLVTILTLLATGAAAQERFQVQPAEPVTLPILIDSNTPVFWEGSRLNTFSSAGSPYLNSFSEELSTHEVRIDSNVHFPMWIESIWRSPDGAMYAWYHYERVEVCPGTKLHTPEIGALVSYDGGNSFKDLGIVLTSGERNDCSSQNGFFASGHGDFSVVLDREGQYFYFLFGAYGGDVSRQGVAVARMAFNDLGSPVGTVWKYHAGEWSEPGLGGQVTPIFPATVSWQDSETDSFWGPSIHWNTYLEKYVVVMNRSCCYSGWPQEGVYLSMNADLSSPEKWTQPVKILETGDWYPWILGAGEGETSSEAGKVVRLFVRNLSEWEIVFEREGEQTAPEVPSDDGSED